MDEEKPRVSKRENKGIPPDLYGDWVRAFPSVPFAPPRMSASGGPATSTPMDGALVKGKGKSDPGPGKPASVKSLGSLRSSVSSASSIAVRTRTAELEFAAKMVKAEEELERREQERRDEERERDRRRFERSKEIAKIQLDVERLKIELDEEGFLSDDSQQLSDDDGDVVQRNVLVTKTEKKSEQCPRSTHNNQPQDWAQVMGSVIANAVTQLTAASSVVPQRAEEPGTSLKFLARQTMGRDLPYFSGSPEEWPCFIAEFEMTTTECGFSAVENMCRLRKCLKGKAREAV